ncbi:hypothetical protein JIN82_05945 [Persicirhabdus sediminis]|uniref:Uncharacterized protein n=1 Tax=Persicirhabdus sediminis TaxID=454144 RepID=A0A8J7SIL4_9BACT|nr:hypothetical protein [Persicirhabdus sediminis]
MKQRGVLDGEIAEIPALNLTHEDADAFAAWADPSLRLLTVQEAISLTVQSMQQRFNVCSSLHNNCLIRCDDHDVILRAFLYWRGLSEQGIEPEAVGDYYLERLLVTSALEYLDTALHLARSASS